ncbi:hypothetical protein BOTBODRAFT_167101 [Botryobasidium botryosum FD-172 SS1]|uniref:Cytochrome P450 n=1 Tax=Botryobasidium botryosum (strain FD-172 SS1) TaxID=930990 RepID=A0A067LVK6_BOTB1|nr:hypothetical protein BOTBODRAFT_167101 [Botryobasidium botryosum FD-172 SS1]
MLTTAIFTFVALYLVVRAVLKYLSGLRAVNNVPGYRCAFSTTSLPGMILPTSLGKFWCNPGPDFLVLLRHSVYTTHDVISVVPYLVGAPEIYVPSVEVMRQVSGYSPQFDKELDSPFDYVFGSNIVTAPRAPWKRHRRALNPAFSQKLYEMVWTETITTFQDMVATEGWGQQDSTPTIIMNDITTKFALAVVSSCAFGLKFPWAEPPKSADGTMTLQESLVISTRDAAVRAFAPRWVYRLPIKYLRDIELAFNTIFAFVRSQIAARRGDVQGKKDMCGLIVEANDEDHVNPKAKLSDDEVVGNVLVSLIAGHETTGKALTAIIALLGLYQDEQEKAHSEIMSVLHDGREATLDDVDSFTHLQHCIMEGMRLFPPLDVLIREATEDVCLRIPSRIPGQKELEVAIKKGTIVSVDIVGIHYNPRYFPDPEVYNPSRWRDITDPDQFVAFGYGPRACAGRKFAMVETVCFLVLLLRDWKIEIVLEKGETPEEWRKRVLVAKVDTITLGVRPAPIRLVRRK